MTKNISSYREILITNRAIKLLNSVLLENELEFNFFDDDDYIFAGKTGKSLQLNFFNSSIKVIHANVGKKRIKNKQLSNHIFRHTHVSILAELGIPLKAVMERVGHEDGDTTTKIYTHVTKKLKIDVPEKLNNIDM